MRVLLVKLPEDIAEYIPLVLKVRWSDLTVFAANESTEAMRLIHSEQPHLAILHLPDRSDRASHEECFDLIGNIRGFSGVPLIILGQEDDVMDRVRALEAGADDWVSMGFSPMEFIAKVGAILRRCSPHEQGVGSFLGGRLSIDYAARQVSVLGRAVKLTPIQYKILCHLAENEGRVCTSTELLQRVWGPHCRDAKELLKLNVYRLRSKLKQDPADPEIIFNERGTGYIIRPSGSGL